MFHLNAQYNNNDVEAYMTKLTLVITRVLMLHFTRQCKDTLQNRMKILMSFRSKFISVHVYQ